MDIPIEKIRELRERTGSGVLDCKKALMTTDGDIDKAIEHLRKLGIAKAATTNNYSNLNITIVCIFDFVSQMMQCRF